jgi:hypothetical protein
MRATCSSHFILIYLITLISLVFSEDIKLVSVQFSPLSSTSVLGPNILLILVKTLSVLSFPQVEGHGFTLIQKAEIAVRFLTYPIESHISTRFSHAAH